MNKNPEKVSSDELKEEWEEKMEAWEMREEGLWDILKKAKREGDERKEVWVWLQFAQIKLMEVFDVDDLTTIEGVRLRKIVEQVLRENKAMRKESKAQLKAGNKHKAWLIELNRPTVEEESAYRWLQELYGINVEDVQFSFTVEDKTDGKVYTYFDESEADRKEKKLRDSGQETWAVYNVDAKFKEYIKRLRAKSHNP